MCVGGWRSLMMEIIIEHLTLLLQSIGVHKSERGMAREVAINPRVLTR